MVIFVIVFMRLNVKHLYINFFVDCLDPSPENVLDLLQNHKTTTSALINEQQRELNDLRTLCASLHRVS